MLVHQRVPIKLSESLGATVGYDCAPGSCIQMGVSFLWDIPLVLPSMINGTMILTSTGFGVSEDGGN